MDPHCAVRKGDSDSSSFYLHQPKNQSRIPEESPTLEPAQLWKPIFHGSTNRGPTQVKVAAVEGRNRKLLLPGSAPRLNICAGNGARNREVEGANTVLIPTSHYKWLSQIHAFGCT